MCASCCRRSFCPLVLLVLLAAICCCQSGSVATPTNHTTNYEQAALRILDVGTQRMRTIWDMRRRIFLQLTAKGKSPLGGQAPSKQEVEMETYRLMYELAANLSVIPVQQLHDPLLQRRVQRLSKLQLQGLQPEAYEQSKDLLRTMQNFISGALVCAHEDCSVRRPMAMYPQMYNHNMRTKRYDDLRFTWTNWRKAINENDVAKTTFIEYVRLLRIAATYNGHVTPSRTWYLNFDTENFQAEMEAGE